MTMGAHTAGQPAVLAGAPLRQARNSAGYWAATGRARGHEVISRPGDLAPELLDDLALFLTGGSAAVINTWVIEGSDPLDPEAFTDRLLRMLPVVTRRPSDRESQP